MADTPANYDQLNQQRRPVTEHRPVDDIPESDEGGEHMGPVSEDEDYGNEDQQLDVNVPQKKIKKKPK